MYTTSVHVMTVRRHPHHVPCTSQQIWATAHVLGTFLHPLCSRTEQKKTIVASSSVASKGFRRRLKFTTGLDKVPCYIEACLLRSPYLLRDQDSILGPHRTICICTKWSVFHKYGRISLWCLNNGIHVTKCHMSLISSPLLPYPLPLTTLHLPSHRPLPPPLTPSTLPLSPIPPSTTHHPPFPHHQSLPPPLTIHPSPITNPSLHPSPSTLSLSPTPPSTPHHPRLCPFA